MSAGTENAGGALAVAPGTQRGLRDLEVAINHCNSHRFFFRKEVGSMSAFRERGFGLMTAALFCLWLAACTNQPRDETNGRTAPLLEGMGDLHHPVTTKSKMAQRFFDQGLTLS